MVSKFSVCFVNFILLINFWSAATCPTVCKCQWRSGKFAASCLRQNLGEIPQGFKSVTQVLQLSGNNLQLLPSKVFQQRDLIHLQKINLSDCNLHEITGDAFTGLRNLVELDLSGNMLPVIPTEAFAGLPTLRRLSLSGNLIKAIQSDAFLPLTNLVSLDLSRCQIDLIESDAFQQLERLQILKLHSNLLTSLSPDILEDTLQQLSQISIHSNPWHCDCHLKPIHSWIVSENVSLYELPTCSSPDQLFGSSWLDSNFDPEELVCPILDFAGTEPETSSIPNISMESDNVATSATSTSPTTETPTEPSDTCEKNLEAIETSYRDLQVELIRRESEIKVLREQLNSQRDQILSDLRDIKALLEKLLPNRNIK